MAEADTAAAETDTAAAETDTIAATDPPQQQDVAELVGHYTIVIRVGSKKDSVLEPPQCICISTLYIHFISPVTM